MRPKSKDFLTMLRNLFRRKKSNLQLRRKTTKKNKKQVKPLTMKQAASSMTYQALTHSKRCYRRRFSASGSDESELHRRAMSKNLRTEKKLLIKSTMRNI